jgi:hypothetical protein
MTKHIPFDPSWLGKEPGQLTTKEAQSCLVWLDRAIPSLPGQDKAKYLATRAGLQAEFSWPGWRKPRWRQGGLSSGGAWHTQGAASAGGTYNSWNLWGSR